MVLTSLLELQDAQLDNLLNKHLLGRVSEEPDVRIASTAREVDPALFQNPVRRRASTKASSTENGSVKLRNLK